MTSLAPSLRRLVKTIHEDEAGAVSLETILLIGVIALPVLAFLYKFAWPAFKDYFIQGANQVGITVQPGN